MKGAELMKARETAWLVKGRPDRNDLKRALRPRRLERWVTKRPPKSWLDGDLVFLWEAAPALAVCGLAELVRVEPPRRDGETFFDLRYLTPYLGRAVPIATLRVDAALRAASFLKSGPAGTVFPLSARQAVRLGDLVLRACGNLASLTLRRPSRRADTRGLALSVRQPWAERILLGVKQEEFRSFATWKRGRVMLYASLKKGPDERAARHPGLDQLTVRPTPDRGHRGLGRNRRLQKARAPRLRVGARSASPGSRPPCTAAATPAGLFPPEPTSSPPGPQKP